MVACASARRPFVCASFLAFLLSGCAGGNVHPTTPAASALRFSGRVLGGQSPISGATIQLYQVGVLSNGGASTSLLNTVVTTSDGTGLPNANANVGNAFNTLPVGNFTISGDYTCPVPSTLVYITASGGNAGSTSANSDSELLAALGQCNTLSGSTTVQINEVTTVGTVAALYPYMTAYNAIGSTPANASALAAAFNTAAAYMNFATGTAPGPALASGYSASDNDVRSLANSVAACINSAGGVTHDGSPCGSLFYLSKPASSSAATDTVGALIDILNNPTNNTADIFSLGTADAPFAPSDAVAPSDWTAPILVAPGTPVITPAGGTYTSVQTVTLTDSDTSSTSLLYYTVDGSTPTAASIPYTGPFTLSSTETVKAVDIESGRLASPIASASFSLSGITTPTVSITPSPVNIPYGATNMITLTAFSTAEGSTVTFSTPSSLTGVFNDNPCTIYQGSCQAGYFPSSTIPAGNYPTGFTASFGAYGTYGPASASTALIIQAYGLTLLDSFSGTSGPFVGAAPQFGNLIQAMDGNFYGISSTGGGSGNYGTAFKITPAGVPTVLHTFTSATTDGEHPEGGLIQGTDGNFYGTTYSGGLNGYGTVYKMTPAGAVSLLHSFSTATTDGKNPQSALVQGTDGYLYGTLSSGAGYGYGGLFKISTTGTYTLLHSFNGNDGNEMVGGLLEGSDGNFYGLSNDASADGKFFKVTSSGTFTALHTFSGYEGGLMSGTLIQGSDGNFYGNSQNGGSYSWGTAFRITPAGSVYVMHAFSPSYDGAYPYSGLVLASDGNFYGSVGYGGASNNGALFRVTTNTFAQIYSFTGGSSGASPTQTLMQGSDGNFYGTTTAGGADSDGILFKLSPSVSLPGPVSLTVPSSVTHAAPFTLGYTVSNAYSTAGYSTTKTTLQTCQYFVLDASGNTTLTGALTGSTTATNATLTAPAAVGTYTVALTCGGMESGFATLNVQ